nr:ring canal kelch protein [Drosophila virilis]
MEEQGALARQAASLAIALLDDENSQAEGTMEGAVGGAVYGNIIAAAAAPPTPAQPVNHPHYENIYAPIGQPNNNNNNNNNNQQVVVANANANAPANVEEQQQQQARMLPMNNYRNDLYDRSASTAAAYDVPRAVRSGLGYRRNFRIDMQNGNRYGSGLRCAPLYASNRSNCQRQRSFDDTESTDGYNLPYAAAGTMRYENIYEQIRDEPLYRTTAAAATSRVPLYTRLDVLGHGIGRIERHLSSSCGNIDHYNLGGHYAVLGHSHFGTVGHIRLNANGAAAASNNASTCTVPNCQGYLAGAAATAGMDYGHVKVPVKNSASSFFSCLHGENSQSMTNIYKTTAAAVAAAHHCSPLTPNVSMEPAKESSTAATAASSSGTEKSATGAAPKSAALAKKTTTATTAATRSNSSSSDAGNGTLNRISKSSLQWLLVNKWLPLWIGQGPECKVIDFNFMFSRDCVNCDTASVASQMSNPYGTPRLGLGTLPQDMMRYQGSTASMRRDANGAAARPLHSNLSRLRCGADKRQNLTAGNSCSSSSYRHEDPSYENVHVQWQNGFEFGRSREYDASYNQQQRPLLQRARSESPTFSNQQRRMQSAAAQVQAQNCQQSAKLADPFKNYELNVDNNSFKPKQPAAMELCDELEGAVGGAAAESDAEQTRYVVS